MLDTPPNLQNHMTNQLAMA